MRIRTIALLAAALAVLSNGPAFAAMRITEWMYNPGPDEFWELTNVGGAPIDMTGWSFDDDSRTPDTVSLSLFGVVNPGESVIIAEDTADNFRTNWGLPVSVDILGSNTTNFGRNDEFNLYDASDALVDRLTYGDDINVPGSIRTQGTSGNPMSAAALGVNNALLWQLSVVGDKFGSATAASGSIGNPGAFVPEPTGLALAALGLGLVMLRRRSA